ncbi:hypothetical protein [Streptococcus cristatus]|uniref:hypothetical protein n=1 Tax=Streptococcus cristatus TaxID=45634 RepID=UPI001653257C|nr:hypothetical protein [Streptococcus cristatus]
MKWTYLCKWLLAILVVVGLSYLHFQANFIPKEILPFVGDYIDCGDLENFPSI